MIPHPPRALPLLLAFTLLGAPLACRRSERHDPAPDAAASAAPPNLVLEPQRHDFGKVVEGERLTHVFVVKNTGGQPLEIASVRASCGCTAAVLAEKVVPPGGSTRIEVTFDTRGRRGRNHKTVTISSNDPDAGSTQLEFSAEVEALVAFEPPQVRLQANHGETPAVEAWLTGKLAANAKLEFDRAALQGIAVEPIERPLDGGVQRGLRVKLATQKIGSEHGKLTITTGLPEAPTIELGYSLQVRGNLTAPQQVYLDPARPTLAERTIQVKSTRPDFKLIGVRVVEGPFQAKLLGPNAKGEQEVRITTSAPADRKTSLPGKLLLLSNDPLEPQKAVKLTVASPRPARSAGSSAAGAAPFPAPPPSG